MNAYISISCHRSWFSVGLGKLDCVCDEIPRLTNNSNPKVKLVVDKLVDGTFSSDKELFRPIYNSLLNEVKGNKADKYFILRDFEDYLNTQKKISEAYTDKKKWARMAMMNTACAGKFSSDRTIKEYVDEIWHLDSVNGK